MATSGFVPRLWQSIHQNRSSPSQPLLFTLCTVSLEGAPRGRWVVCRKVHEDASLVICTSTESNKWKELKANSAFEICWYFATTREQFRIRGQDVELLSHNAPLSRQIWADMSESARDLFRKEREDCTQFGVIKLSPNQVELLETTSGQVTRWSL